MYKVWSVIDALRSCAGMQTPLTCFPPPPPPIYAQDMFAPSFTPTPLRTVTEANIPEDLSGRILDFLDKEIEQPVFSY